ncbi:MAG: dihydroorotate dehydrogenase electron transfer subunit [Thermoguttaceae bacterium]
MSGCGCSPVYPDKAWHGSAEVIENVEMAVGTRRIRLGCQLLSSRIAPGQFVMLRLVGGDDPLLGRPLAMYDVVLDSAGQPWALDVVYLVIGRMTSRLAHVRAGERVEMWGPLGNGFSTDPVDHLVMVGGGIGQTPFLTLGQEAMGRRTYAGPDRSAGWAPRVSLCYGARSERLLAGVDDFRKAGIEVRIATDDGSAGHHGLVTELIEPLVRDTRGTCRIVCCGPEGMMKATARVAKELAVPCQVSLENPMACGMGICFSCVAKVRDDQGGWDYRRTCIEGPVFDAEKIVFD